MKPILFNTEMVKAILDGKKTVTRRVVKKKYANTHFRFKNDKYGTTFIEIQNDIEGETHGKNEDGCSWNKLLGYREPKPPYKVGDILYVRETWQMFNSYSDKEYVYKADNDYSDVDRMIWQPSIHMPKTAARIFLKVIDVRVERLRDITEEQSKQEGIRAYSKDGELYKYCVNDDWWMEFHRRYDKAFDMEGTYWQDMPKTAKKAFEYLWNSTVKKTDINIYGWNANPWVWVIEFERVKCAV